MPFAAVSAKGQVTLPIQIRKALGISPLDRLSIEQHDDSIVIRRIADFFELRGAFGRALPREEEKARMARGIARHLKGERL